MDSKSEAEWRAEDDLRTLMNAERIKKDKQRYSKAMEIAKKQHADLKAVVGEAAVADKSSNPLRGDE